MPASRPFIDRFAGALLVEAVPADWAESRHGVVVTCIAHGGVLPGRRRVSFDDSGRGVTARGF
eukprot:7222065-Lingulodinium_polyedra.AAC.1